MEDSTKSLWLKLSQIVQLTRSFLSIYDNRAFISNVSHSNANAAPIYIVDFDFNSITLSLSQAIDNTHVHRCYINRHYIESTSNTAEKIVLELVINYINQSLTDLHENNAHLITGDPSKTQ